MISEVNTRNVRCYSPHENSHPKDRYVEFTQGPAKVMVWIGLTRGGTSIQIYNMNSLDTTSIRISCDGNKIVLKIIQAMPLYVFLSVRFPGCVIS